MKSSILANILFCAIFARDGLAGAVRLDIGPPGSRVNPGWTAWTVPPGDGHGPLLRKVLTTSFDPDGFSLTLGPARALGCRTAPECAGPEARVLEESVFAHAERPMRLDLSGLAPGRYRVLLWFNDARGYRWPPLKLAVTDAAGTGRVVVAAQPQTAVTNSTQAAVADIQVAPTDTGTVTITASIPPVRKTYVFLSGVEVLGDAPDLGRALHPVPGDNTIGTSRDPTLAWRPAPDAKGHRLFGGDSIQALKLLARLPAAKAEYPLHGLSFGQRYFWRVDEVFGDRTVLGRVWQFTVPPGKATSPFPADGAADIPIAPVVSWKAVSGARTYQVWGGSAPTALKTIGGPVSTCRCRLPRQPWSATVFWRVDTVMARGNVIGDVWRFKVDGGQPRAPRPAHGSTGVDLDTVLVWRCPVPGAVYDVWMGNAPKSLKQVASGIRKTTWPTRGTNWENVFWRIGVRVNGGTVLSPLWHFVRGNNIVLDDFESYDLASHPLGNRWDDGRARTPRRGPAIALSRDGCNGMVIRVPNGDIRLRCSLKDHPDWTVGGVTRLRLILRGHESNPAVQLRARVVDGSGHASEADVVAEIGWCQATRWTPGHVLLSALKNLDLRNLRTLALLVHADGRAIVEIDEIELTDDTKTPRKPGKELHMGRLSDIRGAPPAPKATHEPVHELRADVCIVGGGSGGLGAALAAARKGARVIVVERESILGGTSTAGGISNWEPGPGDAFAKEIASRLAQIPNGIIMDKPHYEDTLTRAGNGHVQFEPEKFHRVVSNMLEETGCCRVLYNTTFTEVMVNTPDQRVSEIRAVDRNGVGYSIRARMFIDCTGSGFLCEAAGCEVMLGAEPRDRFGESGAPDTPTDRLNAIELVYRIRPSKAPIRQELPPGMKPLRGGAAWPQPSGEYFVNTCGSLAPGWLLMEKGYTGTRAELERRALAHWYWLQKEFYPEYEFDRFAPMLAIREAQRIVGEYVLVQQDLLEGIRKQTHPDIVAIADHPMDTHGAGGGLGKVAAPYGIPFRCLVPKGGWRNLLIACRGASFSHIAASSCRLSRTMIALGHAAGLAAAQGTRRECDIPDVDVSAIQRELGMPPGR